KLRPVAGFFDQEVAMGVWTRIKLLLNTEVSGALDRAEDPRQVLDYAYNQQQELLINMRRGLVDVATAKQQLAQQAQTLEPRIPELDAAAEGEGGLKESLGGVYGELGELGMAVGRAEEKAERLQARAKAIDSLVDLGSFPPIGGGDFVEAELLHITISKEIDDELTKIKSEVEQAGSAKESKT